MRLNSDQRVKKYWTDRAAKFGAEGVGRINRDAAFQAQELAIKKRFIFAHCPRNLPTLDYGCGPGHFAPEFEPYLGVDITEQFIAIAKKRHPNKEFILLPKSGLESLDFDYELFFTSSVLQHNGDSLVRRILESVANDKASGFQFALYEFSDQVIKAADHMKARTHKDYEGLISEFFEVKSSKSWAHKIGVAESTLSLIEV